MLGEILGFAAPALTGGAAYAADLSEPQMFAPLVLAGTLEGTVLGAAQASVLRRYMTAIRMRSWIVATAAGAAFAWAVALSLMLAGARTDSIALMVALWALASPLILLSLGVAQWLVLRRHSARAWRWIAGNAAAWIAGLPISIGAISAVPNGAPATAFVAAGVAGGALMGFTVALITGWTMRRILPDAAKPG
jgi:hypothetical protein